MSAVTNIASSTAAVTCLIMGTICAGLYRRGRRLELPIDAWGVSLLGVTINYGLAAWHIWRLWHQ